MAGRGLARGAPPRAAPRPLRRVAAGAAPKRGGGKGFGGAPSMADALARIAKLEAENRALRDELGKGEGGGGDRASAQEPPAPPAPAPVVERGVVAKKEAPAPVEAAAPAPAAPAPARAAPPASTLAALETGIAWPTPGEKFWERAARTAPLVLEASACTTHPPPSRPLNIVHIAAELAPRAKVGGLGDVVAGLSLACAARGHAVAVMLPWYECLKEEDVVGLTLADEFDCPKGARGGSTLRARVFTGALDGVPVLLVRPDWASSNLFRGERIYGGAYNEAEAYLFFCRACLEHLQRAVAAGAREPPTAIHVHDWQACPAAMIYWSLFSEGVLAGARLVLTVHNFDSMGEVKMDEFGATGVDGAEFARIDRALDERTIGHNPERLCLLKGGLVYSNRVVTVSPTYAQEASAGGAAGFLRSTLARPDVAAKFGGVLNGIDVDMWDPASDPLIAAPYRVGAMAGKALNKRYLQLGLGLKVDPAAPLVVCVTRLVPQKGIHLIKRAIIRAAERGGQAVLLGTGHADGDFKAMSEGQFAGSDAVKLMLTYSEPLAHALYAAADIVLVPSLFEPCGLTQMIGLRYGAVPLVRRTGGLADTVHGDGERANGFVFDGTDDAAVSACVDAALDAWWMDRDRFEALRERGMRDDVSWGASAEKYLAFYKGDGE